MSDVSERNQIRNGVRSMRVSGQHDRKSPVVFDPSDDVEDICIHVPSHKEENGKWGERQLAFVQTAPDEQGRKREWTHYAQVSNDVPRKFRVALVHEHEGKHAPQTYTLEYVDYGKFNQSDPNLAMKLPAEVYQTMMGMSVAMREVKLMTLEALKNGEFDCENQDKTSLGNLNWNVAPGIYGLTVAEKGVIASQWELGLSVSKESPPHFRSFARNVETGEEFGLFAKGREQFQVTHAAISTLLPEEVYSSMVGLAVGAQLVRELTLEKHGKGELPAETRETNKNRGFCNRLRSERVHGQNTPQELAP